MNYPKAHRIAKPATPYVPALSSDIQTTIARQQRKLRGKTAVVRIGRLVGGKVVPV